MNFIQLNAAKSQIHSYMYPKGKIPHVCFTSVIHMYNKTKMCMYAYELNEETLEDEYCIQNQHCLIVNIKYTFSVKH